MAASPWVALAPRTAKTPINNPINNPSHGTSHVHRLLAVNCFLLWCTQEAWLPVARRSFLDSTTLLLGPLRITLIAYHHPFSDYRALAPYGSPATSRKRPVGFASPPHGGFAFLEGSSPRFEICSLLCARACRKIHYVHLEQEPERPRTPLLLGTSVNNPHGPLAPGPRTPDRSGSLN